MSGGRGGGEHKNWFRILKFLWCAFEVIQQLLCLHTLISLKNNQIPLILLSTFILYCRIPRFHSSEIFSKFQDDVFFNKFKKNLRFFIMTGLTFPWKHFVLKSFQVFHQATLSILLSSKLQNFYSSLSWPFPKHSNHTNQKIPTPRPI